MGEIRYLKVCVWEFGRALLIHPKSAENHHHLIYIVLPMWQAIFSAFHSWVARKRLRRWMTELGFEPATQMLSLYSSSTLSILGRVFQLQRSLTMVHTRTNARRVPTISTSKIGRIRVICCQSMDKGSELVNYKGKRKGGHFNSRLRPLKDKRKN